MIRKNLFVMILLTLASGAFAGRTVLPGAYDMDAYLPLLEGKRVAVVANQTSVIGDVHLVDTLLTRGVKIVRIFCPEHGFRGEVAEGRTVQDQTDTRTGLPIVSLYGKRKKPLPEDLADVDIVVFDIQDVGVRFYTYISTLHLVMEACAEEDKQVVVLDRPNPNGFYVDGPVLDTTYRSFVGMDPIPVVYGMTIGEYAKMVNGEGWLADSMQCSLTVIPCRNYTHRTYYELPVKPSPNLPTMRSVYLYPSLCFFEGTIMSVGRGTDFPFEVYGHPEYPNHMFSFKPEPKAGASSNPKYNGQVCYGVDLRNIPIKFLRDNKHLVLDWLIDAYKEMNKGEGFFNAYFVKLAGTDQLQKQVMDGKDKYTIRASWKKELEAFKTIRKRYLLYTDFE
jgi:uncharacterized protein YbbC (DUF1343 family)